MAAVCAAAVRTHAQDTEPAIVAEESPGDSVVAEEETASVWSPVEVRLRKIDGQDAYLRPFGEAFGDPDQPLNLEPKYFFVLSEGKESGFDAAAEDNRVEEGFLLSVRPKPKEVARWYRARSADHSRTSQVLEIAEAGAAPLSKPIADRAIEFDKERIIIGKYVLDALDRPPPGRPGANLLGRVIAVLKRVENRYAVGFYGEALHADSDRRLWLTPAEHPWGPPLGLCFHEIPIRKADGVKPVFVISVRYRDRWVAFDFPLARPQAVEQMRQLAARSSATNSRRKAAPAINVSRLLGEDLTDEFSRRLVDAAER